MDDWGSPVELSWAPIDARPATARDAPRGAERRERLADVLKRELIPRLIEARPHPARAGARRAGMRADPEKLARCLVAGQIQAAHEIIAARLASGASTQAVLFEDIAPAARKLGEYWRDDDCDFADVTIATAALRNILREAVASEPESRLADAPSLMISPAAGESHEFGAEAAATVFRQAGWRTARFGFDEGLAALASERFDVAGFSLSCDRYADATRRGIEEARRVSRNRRVTIVVGGPVFASNSSLAGRLGADMCASDVDVAPHFPATILRALRL